MLMPFIKDGIEQGDRSFHIVDPELRAAHAGHLQQEGIQVADAEATGRLEIHTWQEAYIQHDRFDQFRMLELVQESIARQQPGEITRFVGNMEWALEDLPDVHDLLEYETRLNQFLPEYRDPVVCCYDLSRFDATGVIDIMRTHPMVLIGGILQENPFYVPPDEMLKELRECKTEQIAG